MYHFRIPLILVCSFLSCLTVLPAHGFAENSSTIIVDEAVHFLATDGSDVVVGPGTYHVEAADEWLRLIPGERRDALLLKAEAFSHQERIELPSARFIPEEEEQYSLVLLLPDGKAMEAIGSVSGVRSRAVRRARTARAPTARQSVSRIPSRIRKSSTLKKSKPYKRQAPQQQGGAPAPANGQQNIQALEQRIQTLEQQVGSLLSIIQVSQGEVLIQAQALSLQSENLTIETHGGDGLTIASDTNLTINAALNLTAQSGMDLALKGGTNAKLEGGAGATVKAGTTLDLKGGIVRLAGGGRPVAVLGSHVLTAPGGGPGTVTTGSPTVFAP